MLCLVQCHFWFHVQGLYQFFVAQNGALDISGAGWCVLHFGLVAYGPFEGSDQIVDAYFSSCRYVDCVVSGERQCLYDSRCDISDIDEVPCLISTATGGMDDCRKMMPVKGQAEHSTMPAMNQPLPVRLMEIGQQGLWFIFDIWLECYAPISLSDICGKMGPLFHDYSGSKIRNHMTHSTK